MASAGDPHNRILENMGDKHAIVLHQRQPVLQPDTLNVCWRLPDEVSILRFPVKFEPAVAPQVVGRILADRLLQYVAVLQGELASPGIPPVECQQLGVKMVATPPDLLKSDIHHGRIVFDGALFRAGYKGGGAAKEVHPVSRRRVAGVLVGGKCQQVLLFEYIVHFILKIWCTDEYGAVTLAEIEKNAAENGVFNRDINADKRDVEVNGIQQIGILPVELVSGHQVNIPALSDKLVDQLKRTRTAAQQCLFTDGDKLEGFDKGIRKIAVKAFGNLFTFCRRFFGESNRKIVQHHIFPVTDNMIQQKGDPVAEAIEDKER